MEDTTLIINLDSFWVRKSYLEVSMVLKIVVEVKNILPQIPTLVEILFLNRYEGTVFMGDYASSPGHIIDQWYFSKWIPCIKLFLPG